MFCRPPRQEQPRAPLQDARFAAGASWLLRRSDALVLFPPRLGLDRALARIRPDRGLVRHRANPRRRVGWVGPCERPGRSGSASGKGERECHGKHYLHGLLPWLDRARVAPCRRGQEIEMRDAGRPHEAADRKGVDRIAILDRGRRRAVSPGSAQARGRIDRNRQRLPENFKTSGRRGLGQGRRAQGRRAEDESGCRARGGTTIRAGIAGCLAVVLLAMLMAGQGCGMPPFMRIDDIGDGRSLVARRVRHARRVAIRDHDRQNSDGGDQRSLGEPQIHARQYSRESAWNKHEFWATDTLAGADCGFSPV